MKKFNRFIPFWMGLILTLSLIVIFKNNSSFGMLCTFLLGYFIDKN